MAAVMVVLVFRLAEQQLSVLRPTVAAATPPLFAPHQLKMVRRLWLSPARGVSGRLQKFGHRKPRFLE